jgi:hypothetical protein
MYEKVPPNKRRQTDLQGRLPLSLELLPKSGFAERGNLAYALQAADAWR